MKIKHCITLEKMEKVCDNCGENYEVYPIVGLEEQTELCKVCRFDEDCGKIGKMKLCKNERCLPCYDGSFLSNERSECWDFERNEKNPRDMAKNSHKKFWFKCEKDECGHSFEMRLSNISCHGCWCSFCGNQKLCENPDCVPCNDKSFSSHEKSEFWDHEKNGISPRDVFKSSGKKFWFKCEDDECMHSFEVRLNHISSSESWCPFCANKKLCEAPDCVSCNDKSFSSYEKSEFWDYEKNGISPRDVFRNNNKKFWFKCEDDDCGHSFEIRLSSISSKGCWCSFCGNKKLCEDPDCTPCNDKSFSSHEKSEFWDYEKNKISPRDVFKSTDKKFWFKCKDDECGHSFEMQLDNISSSGKWCIFCGNKKLCEDPDCVPCNDKSFSSHEKSEFWDYEKNGISPRDVFKNSGKKFWFKCEEKHSFDIKLNNISSGGNWCRFCKNKTEKKFAHWLEAENYSFEREKKFPWCKNKKTERLLPFDFVLEKEKIIIEIDGIQHFKQISNWTCPKFTQERDIFKQNKALENKYTLIRLLQEDVLRKKYWKEEIKKNIYFRDEPKLIFICNNKEYESTHSS